MHRKTISRLLLLHTGDDVTFEELLTKVVPLVRTQLIELTRENLLRLFDEADTDRSGMLSMAETVRLFQLTGTCPDMDDALSVIQTVMPRVLSSARSVEGVLVMSQAVLNFEDFILLMQGVEEHTARMHFRSHRRLVEEFGLTEEEQKLWKYDLVELHECWAKYCRATDQHSHSTCGRDDPEQSLNTTSSDILGPEFSSRVGRLFSVVYHMPSLPMFKGMPERLALLLSRELDKDDDPYQPANFLQCLRVLSDLRRSICRQCENAFRAWDASGNGELSLTECRQAFKHTSLVSWSEGDEDEAISLIMEFDVNRSGELDCDEFVGIVLFLSKWVSARQRELQRRSAFAHGWGDAELAEIQRAYMHFDVDLDRALDTAEAVAAMSWLVHHSKVLEWLQPQHAQELLLQAVSQLESERCSGRKDTGPLKTIDFIGFLRLAVLLDKQKSSVQERANLATGG